ncbi:MAG: SusD/RagB family nutrient-binding outer membrane lipoprotein [Gemmatimonadetes bacterium]|nr:SusD/RagB family nutrient-binding outer membrane lipoprotein [Gemmatimonadota bacterium]
MNRYLKACAATALVATGACSDFLSGDKLDSDPNRATSAQASQLFTAMQVNSYYVLNGHAARVLAMWTQQMAGTDRQYIGYDQYSVTEGNFGEFTAAFTGGGLPDIRAIQADATTAGNRTMLGIAKVWEAMLIGFLTSNYGAIPYSQAADPAKFPTPKLDDQVAVYAALQTLLDGAIADLQANRGSVGNLDLSFGGDPAPWIRVARTLKARFYMHTAETNSGAYALALAQAQQGISSKAGNLTEYHSSSSGEENIWWQFIARDRDSYIRPGKFLVDLMKQRNDPRIPEYFALNDNGEYGGAAPGQGLDPELHSNLSDTRLTPDFAQPLVTWEETQGIIAEAAYRGGNETLARTAMNALRTDAGMTALTALTGPALLKQIMEEKYIAIFQSTEVMADYKRTCYPNLTPANNSSAAGIPARFTYPVAERTSNPNIPAVGSQPRRNANDPANATSVDGTACRGQK